MKIFVHENIYIVLDVVLEIKELIGYIINLLL